MQQLKKKFIIRLIALQFVLAAIVLVSMSYMMPLVSAQTQLPLNPAMQDVGFLSMLVLGVALSISIPTIGAAAAISALTERESTFSKAIVFVALGETLAIYGLIVAILLMQYLAKAVV
jgi:V/A-type H+-transporting ATPase subunit K